jgi:CHAT domain-containing protein/lipopolysaccharide biosynthesis regulator YciM
MNTRHKSVLLVIVLCLLAVFSGTFILHAESTEESEERYNRLMGDMNHHYQAGRLDQALAAVKKATEVAERAFGEEHAYTTTAMFTLAQLLQSMGSLPEAEVQFLTVLERYENSFDAGDLDKAIVRESLASVYLARGHYDKAEAQYIRVLEKKKALLGDEDVEVAYTVGSLAELYRRMGFYDRAGTLFDEAIERISDQAGDNSPGVFSLLANQARLFEDQGAYEKAEKTYLQVWTFDRKSLGEKHPNTIIDLNNLAGIYRKQGFYRQAENALQKVLADSREVFGARHPESITALNNLGLLYENIGLYDKAEPCFSVAIKDAVTVMGREHPRTITIMNNLALLYESQGLFDKSEPLYLRVIRLNTAVKGDDHPDTVAAANNLAFLYMLQKKYVKADKQFQVVLKTWEKRLGKTHQNTLKALNNLARANYGRGRHERAEMLFVQALQSRRETLGPKHPDAIRSMIDLAKMYLALNRLPEAETMLAEALTLAEKNLGSKHPYTFEALNSLGDVYEAEKELSKAMSLREKGFERRSNFLDRVLWATGENARQGYIRLHKPEQDRFVRLLVRMNTPEAARMALCTSLQRKGLLLKIASEIQQIVQMSGSPELHDLTQELQSIQKQLAARTLSGPAGESAETFQQKLLTLEEKRNEIQARLGRASLLYRNRTQQVRVEDVLEHLDENTALVDFLVYKDRRSEVLAVVATKDGKQGNHINLVSLGKLLIMQQAVAEYRRMIQAEDTEEDELKEAGQELYATIWKPLLPYLKNRQTIYIVPDSILHLLPFDTLIDESDRYLLESRDLRILSSSRDLAISALPTAEEGILIVAGPDYDVDTIQELKKEIMDRRGAVSNGLRLASVGLRSLSFDKLAGAEKEGAAIKTVSDRLKIKSTIYSKGQAEEQQLRLIKQPPWIVHIATHGFFLKPEDSMIRRLLSLQRGVRNRLPPPGDNPLLRAGLAFAGINANAPFLGDIDTNNDGILTALEALKLNLSGTELVVLSACETGVGEIHAGEGVYGLRRAFQEAGVSSVLNSLWPVSDEGTRLLMVGFYNEMLAGKTVRQALKASQLSMLKTEWDHPYYWAAFVVVGKR